MGADIEGARVRLLAGSWFAPVAGETFAMVVSNPPYLADDDPHLREGDLRFEPRLALACGPDGLEAIREIVAAAPAHLQAGGWLLVEHGWTQGDAVRALLDAAGFGEVAAQVDQLVDVARGPQAPKASVQVLGHAVMIAADHRFRRPPSG